MDAVNRRISMKMMIETANTSDKKQYILITPQDMTNVQLGPTVRVLRMSDPERGNGMLPFASTSWYPIFDFYITYRASLWFNADPHWWYTMVHLIIIMFIILTDYAELYFCLYLSLTRVVSYPSMLGNLIMDVMSILDVCLCVCWVSGLEGMILWIINYDWCNEWSTVIVCR